MELKDFKKEFDALMAENQKLADLKKRYQEHAKFLKSRCEQIAVILEELVDLAAQIDPVIQLNNRSYRKISQNTYDSIITRMSGGQQITRGFLMKSFPDINENNVGNILTRIKKMPNVKLAKEGTSIRLYL